MYVFVCEREVGIERERESDSFEAYGKFGLFIHIAHTQTPTSFHGKSDSSSHFLSVGIVVVVVLRARFQQTSSS